MPTSPPSRAARRPRTSRTPRRDRALPRVPRARVGGCSATCAPYSPSGEMAMDGFLAMLRERAAIPSRGRCAFGHGRRARPRRRAPALRQLPPVPAEHLHGQAHARASWTRCWRDVHRHLRRARGPRRVALSASGSRLPGPARAEVRAGRFRSPALGREVSLRGGPSRLLRRAADVAIPSSTRSTGSSRAPASGRDAAWPPPSPACASGAAAPEFLVVAWRAATPSS